MANAKEDVRKTETELVRMCITCIRICVCNCYVNTDH